MPDFLTSALKALPSAATNPLAIVAYLALTGAWLAVALKVRRNQQLLQHLEKLPERDRRRLLEAEMGHVRLRSGLTADQWLKAKIYEYVFIGFLALCALIAVLFAIAAFTTRQNDIVPNPLATASTPKRPDPTPQASPGAILLSESFDDPESSNFPETTLSQSSNNSEISTKYIEGGYSIIIPNTDLIRGAPDIAVPGVYADVSAEIHGRILGGTIGAVLTLSCRSQKTSQSKYILFVQPDNRKSYLARIDSGNHTILSDWRVSSSILPGNQYNRLELNCAKNGITARVNGALVATSQDNSYREGGIEFGAGLMSETRVPIEARFDNLMIIQR